MPEAQEIAAAVAAKVARGHYKLSAHAEQECQQDRITAGEIEEALERPELLEDYPDDKRGPSGLVLGWTKADSPIHAVVGKLLGDEKLVIITVYRPDPARWIDWRKRR